MAEEPQNSSADIPEIVSILAGTVAAVVLIERRKEGPLEEEIMGKGEEEEEEGERGEEEDKESFFGDSLDDLCDELVVGARSVQVDGSDFLTVGTFSAS